MNNTNAIIPINYDGDRPTVSGRELHRELGVSTPYHKWFPRMCEYGFTENVDYRVTDKNVHNSGGGPQTIMDHELTLNMAKEISMIQRNEAGKRIRLYLIQVEEAWNSPMQIMSRALVMANKEIETFREKVLHLESENKQQAEKIALDAPKVLFSDSVSASHTSILIFDLAKLIKQNGVDIGGKRLFQWMRENKWLISRKGADYNMPTQRAMEQGLFEIKESTVSHPDGHISVTRTPKVTGKGQVYFVNKFLGDAS